MFRRALIFIAAAVVLLMGLGVLAVLFNTPSGKEIAALAAIKAEENALSRDFDIVVVRAGFQKRTSGRRDLYVPCLLVRTANLTEQTSRSVTLGAEFLKKDRIFCAARNRVPPLKPGETWEIWLKCIDFVGFGSVAWGLSLAETTEGMTFEIVLNSGRASIVAAKDKLTSMLF